MSTPDQISVEPLKSITKKPIHTAPKRLQHMLLCLQKYDIEVTYMKGTEMYIVDTYPVPLSLSNKETQLQNTSSKS